MNAELEDVVEGCGVVRASIYVVVVEEDDDKEEATPPGLSGTTQ